MDFFRLSTAALAVLLIAVLAGSVAIGVLVGRAMRDRPGTRHETAGVVQGALLGLVGLLLAFGLSMAVGRYESRRALVVQEANDIGTTYLRAQLLAEPESSESLALLEDYTGAAIDVADAVPDTAEYRTAVTNLEGLQGELWTLAGDAVDADPVGTGPRLYVETLNDMFDTHTSRVASLGNRVPTPVMMLLVFGRAVAVGVLPHVVGQGSGHVVDHRCCGVDHPVRVVRPRSATARIHRGPGHAPRAAAGLVRSAIVRCTWRTPWAAEME
jgi:hypothetical protein